MKKFLLFTFLASSSFVFSQTCIVNTSALDAYISPDTWGIMPDTTDNLPAAYINVQYDTFLSFKLPLYANELDPSLPAIQLATLELIDIKGLPAGILFDSLSPSTDSIYCDNAGCSWTASSYGCLRIIGTPTVTGVFPLVITLKGTTIGGPFAQTGTGDINGYKLNITPVGIEVIKPVSVVLKQNAPNPFSTYTNINFSLAKQADAKFYVMNLLGKVVYSKEFKADQGENKLKFDASLLNKGIYLYTIEVEGVKMTKRMIIEK
ncbi:MAG: T9SS type A sorting domain-containing protein [Flavobacteriales bacterium]